MEAYISDDETKGAAVEQLLWFDYYSVHYGLLDGYSFCSHSYDLVFTPVDLPLWMTIEGNKVTIEYNTLIDFDDEALIEVNVLRDNVEMVVERKFWVRMLCDVEMCDPTAGGKTPLLPAIENA